MMVATDGINIGEIKMGEKIKTKCSECGEPIEVDKDLVVGWTSYLCLKCRYTNRQAVEYDNSRFA